MGDTILSQYGNYNNMNKLSYTTKEVTEMTGIRRQTIYLLIEEGLLKPIKIGRTYLFEHNDLMHFLEWAKGMTLTSKEMIKIAKLKKPL